MKPEERELVRYRLERVEKRLEESGQAGFTLIEMVITIVVIGIIAGISAMLILQAMRGYSDQDARADLTNQARLAVERMAREIREIRDCTATDITTMVPGTLAFVDNTGAAIAYDGGNGPDAERDGAGVQRLRAHFRILKAERSGGRRGRSSLEHRCHADRLAERGNAHPPDPCASARFSIRELWMRNGEAPRQGYCG